MATPCLHLPLAPQQHLQRRTAPARSTPPALACRPAAAAAPGAPAAAPWSGPLCPWRLLPRLPPPLLPAAAWPCCRPPPGPRHRLRNLGPRPGTPPHSSACLTAPGVRRVLRSPAALEAPPPASLRRHACGCCAPHHAACRRHRRPLCPPCPLRGHRWAPWLRGPAAGPLHCQLGRWAARAACGGAGAAWH